MLDGLPVGVARNNAKGALLQALRIDSDRTANKAPPLNDRARKKQKLEEGKAAAAASSNSSWSREAVDLTNEEKIHVSARSLEARRRKRLDDDVRCRKLSPVATRADETVTTGTL